jgi:biuret amidohydrolase
VHQLYGMPVPASLQSACDPCRTALLIYDMQVGIVSQISSGDAIIENVSRLLAAARAGGYRIFYTRHTWLPREVMGVGQLRRAELWGQVSETKPFEPPFLPGSLGADIVPELAPRVKDAVVDKITMSAFCGTYLDLAMRDVRIDSFIIAGIALEIGIEPTVRHACDLNYIPIVAADACGSRSEDARRRVLDGFSFGEEVFVSDTDTLQHLMHGAP